MALVGYGLGRFGDRRLEKGWGPVARRAGGATGDVYSPPWARSSRRDAIPPIAAQSVGDGPGEVAACRNSDRTAGDRPACCGGARHRRTGAGQPAVAAAVRAGRQGQRGRCVTACVGGGGSRQRRYAGSGVDAGLEPEPRGIGAAAQASHLGQGTATLDREHPAAGEVLAEAASVTMVSDRTDESPILLVRLRWTPI